MQAQLPMNFFCIFFRFVNFDGLLNVLSAVSVDRGRLERCLCSYYGLAVNDSIICKVQAVLRGLFASYGALCVRQIWAGVIIRVYIQMVFGNAYLLWLTK